MSIQLKLRSSLTILGNLFLLKYKKDSFLKFSYLKLSYLGLSAILFSLGLLGLSQVNATELSSTSVVDVSKVVESPLQLTEYFGVLEDAGLSHSIVDVQKTEIANQFDTHVAPSEALRLGFTKSAYWLRLTLSNPSGSNLESMLEIAYAGLSNIQFYQPLDNGDYRSLETGGAQPFNTRPYRNHYFVFPVSVPANSEKVYYFRIKSTGAMIIPAKLWAPKAFLEYERDDYIAQSFYFGIALAMIIFNLLLFTALRNSFYLMYVSFVTFMALAINAQNGIAQEFLWPEASSWADISRFVAYALSLATIMLFMRLLLSTSQLIPRFDRFIKRFAVMLLFFPMVLAVSFETFVKPAVIIYVFALFLVLFTGIYCAIKRQRTAVYFVAPFAMLCLGGLAIPLSGIGLLPVNILTLNGLQIGSTIEMLLLALALADRFNVIRLEKEKAQKEALEAQQSLVKILQLSEYELEKRVRERSEALNESESRYRTLVERSPEPIAVYRDGIILYVNPAAILDIGAKSAHELVGKSVLDRIHPDCHEQVRERARHYEEQGLKPGNYEEKFIKMDGAVIDVEVQSTEIFFDGGLATQVALRDVTSRKAASNEILNLAFYDALTGLPNRRLLLDRLNHALAASSRSGREGALLFIDLDNFKTLNDTLGHDYGDLLLKQVAQRLLACVNEGDTVARMGGDEFVVMLENLSDHDLGTATYTETVAEKILVALNTTYQLDTHKYKSAASIGASLFRGYELEVDELLKQADIAMYQAKKAGRNTIRFFDPQMQDIINARVLLEGELHSALENNQFQLYYQLQVDNFHRPVGAEGLLRWNHPERGVISSEQFIPLAEDTGLILPIGQWVLDAACAQLGLWQKDALTRDLVLAVNVSAKQFRKFDFAYQVQEAIQRHEINPRKLKLELTESLLMESTEEIVYSMKMLNKLGIKFSLDDFGTGYSSLQYLKQLPFDQLKIDQSFVRDIVADSNDRAIVRTIIAMADSLNMGVIAEGVETEEQRQILMRNGCNTYQGYLFGKAMPINVFENLLVDGQDAVTRESAVT
jgi:diguanylate cyclase (GGDEF)-like protein/PAS domain S-box-containing protein